MHMWRIDHNILIAQMTGRISRIASLHPDNPRSKVTHVYTIRVEAESLWPQKSVIRAPFNKVGKS